MLGPDAFVTARGGGDEHCAGDGSGQQGRGQTGNWPRRARGSARWAARPASSAIRPGPSSRALRSVASIGALAAGSRRRLRGQAGSTAAAPAGTPPGRRRGSRRRRSGAAAGLAAREPGRDHASSAAAASGRRRSGCACGVPAIGPAADPECCEQHDGGLQRGEIAGRRAEHADGDPTQRDRVELVADRRQ